MAERRKVYLDWGAGEVDVSDYALYNDLTITNRAASNDYHRAQNVASLSLVYDETVFSGIYNATSDIWLRIGEVHEGELYPSDTLFPAEDLYPLDPLSGSATVRTIFYGVVPPTASRRYNGVLNVTKLRLEGIEPSKFLDVPVGDILYENFTIMNPANPATSIVHQLAYRAGYTEAQIDPNVTISGMYEYFAPNDEDDSILDILDILLFENGYTFGMDQFGRISPNPWIIDTDSAYILPFNESNIIEEIEIDEQEREYDAIEVKWYELGSRENTRLYTADLPYDFVGAYAGYAILPGTYWPVEANVIDDLTGNLQIVDQEYTTKAIEYFTNKAIVGKLDYNYKAFKSDFSEIIATKDHVLSYNAPGVTLVSSAFQNKKAQILLRNEEATPKDLYYLHIDGLCIYKSAQRKVVAGVETNSARKDSYESAFIFDKTKAEQLAKNMVQLFAAGNTLYTFKCATAYPVGAVASVFTDDSVNQISYILERTYEEYTGLYTYKLKGYESNEGVLISNKVTVPPASTGTVAESTETIKEVVNEYAPSYRGRFADSPPATGNTQDRCLVYSSISGTRGLYVYSGGWAKIDPPSSETISNAWADICAVTTEPAKGGVAGGPYGVPTDYTGTGVNFIEVLGANVAFLNEMFANFIKVQTGGSIRGGDRFNADGTDNVTTASGFWLGANGTLKLRGGAIEASTMKSADNKLQFSDTLDTIPRSGFFAATANIDTATNAQAGTLGLAYSPLTGTVPVFGFVKKSLGVWANEFYSRIFASLDGLLPDALYLSYGSANLMLSDASGNGNDELRCNVPIASDRGMKLKRLSTSVESLGATFTKLEAYNAFDEFALGIRLGAIWVIGLDRIYPVTYRKMSATQYKVSYGNGTDLLINSGDAGGGGVIFYVL